MSGLFETLTGLASGGGPYAWIAGIGLLLLGAFGLYFKGRSDKGRSDKLDKAEATEAAHERMNDAPNGSAMSDDQRREWLSRFGDRHGRK